MDISRIDENYIELFDNWYCLAAGLIEVEPSKASPKQIKKMRAYIQKLIADEDEYPQKIKALISKDRTDAEILDLLISAHKYIERNGTIRDHSLEKHSADMPQDVREAFKYMIDNGVYCCDTRKEGDDILIDLENAKSYRRTLILKNASGVPSENFDTITFENTLPLSKTDDGYKLIGVAESFLENMQFPFATYFNDAEVKITVLNAAAEEYWQSPWEELEAIASSIRLKHDLSPDLLCEKEKAILPLINELSMLSRYYYDINLIDSIYFESLRALAQKHGCTKVLNILDKLSQNPDDSKKRINYILKLNTILNDKKYERMWREVRDLLADSQSDYPTETETFVDKDELLMTRKRIEELMAAHGYSGTYPDFVKRAPMKSLHLAESYDMQYFVGFEKNVEYFIHCVEACFNRHLEITLICGTALLKHGERPTDAHTCRFNSQGHTFAHTIRYESGYVGEDGKSESDDLELAVSAAVKKAELKRLTKNEKQRLNIYAASPISIFLFVFVLAGGMFAGFMTLAMLLICILVTAVYGLASEIPEMLSAMPWLLILLIGWIGFGVAMGIVTVISKRK